MRPSLWLFSLTIKESFVGDVSGLHFSTRAKLEMWRFVKVPLELDCDSLWIWTNDGSNDPFAVSGVSEDSRSSKSFADGAAKEIASRRFPHNDDSRVCVFPFFVFFVRFGCFRALRFVSARETDDESTSLEERRKKTSRLSLVDDARASVIKLFETQVSSHWLCFCFLKTSW